MNRRQTDGNHKAIGQALRGVTRVLDVHTFGPIGCDFLARHVVTKQPMMIEVKDPTQKPSARKLTENEQAMATAYPDNWRLVLTTEDALRAVGAIR